MNLPKSKLKKVTYLRSSDTSKSYKILLAGNSRWMSDVELLLEDEWKNVFRIDEFSSFSKALVEKNPKVCVIEYGGMSEESRIYDSIFPNGTQKLCVAHEVVDTLSWRRKQRELASKGFKCIEMAADAKAASEEFREIFLDFSQVDYSFSEDLQTVKAAYAGYNLIESERDQSQLNIFKTLSSKFVFEPSDIVAGTLLVETFALWKAVKSGSSQLFFSFSNIESSINDPIVLKLVDFSALCCEEFKKSSVLSEEKYTELVTKIGFGRLATRVLKNDYLLIVSILGASNRQLRLVA